MVSGNSIVVAAKEQAYSELDGEAVILHLKSGVYYSLNSTGASIWNLLQKPRKVSEIRDVILEEYEVEPQQCEGDLLVLLQELELEGLVEVSNEAAA